MMVLACIVAFPETKLRGYKIYREKRTFYIATWKVSKGINVNKKAIYIFIKKFLKPELGMFFKNEGHIPFISYPEF